MTIAIFVLLVALSAANGGNDVPKGVATLTGPAAAMSPGSTARRYATSPSPGP